MLGCISTVYNVHMLFSTIIKPPFMIFSLSALRKLTTPHAILVIGSTTLFLISQDVIPLTRCPSIYIINATPALRGGADAVLEIH